jgi:hypothetical protein
MPGDKQFDRVAAEGLPAAGGEQRAVEAAAALVQPGPQRPGHLRGDRGAAFLAAFAQAADVRAGAEVDVGAGERGELGDPQPGLDGQGEQGMIAAPHPAGPVRCSAENRSRISTGRRIRGNAARGLSRGRLFTRIPTTAAGARPSKR